MSPALKACSKLCRWRTGQLYLAEPVFYRAVACLARAVHHTEEAIAGTTAAFLAIQRAERAACDEAAVLEAADSLGNTQAIKCITILDLNRAWVCLPEDIVVLGSTSGSTRQVFPQARPCSRVPAPTSICDIPTAGSILEGFNKDLVYT